MKFILIFIFTSFFVSAHEAGETEVQVGPGKAVEAFDKAKGIKLSEKAIKNLNIQTKKLTSAQAPASAILATQDRTSVFVKQNEWFRSVSTKEVKPGDEVVIQGAALLRVALVNVSSDSEEEEHHEGEEHNENEGDDHD